MLILVQAMYKLCTAYMYSIGDMPTNISNRIWTGNVEWNDVTVYSSIQPCRSLHCSILILSMKLAVHVVTCMPTVHVKFYHSVPHFQYSD